MSQHKIQKQRVNAEPSTEGSFHKKGGVFHPEVIMNNARKSNKPFWLQLRAMACRYFERFAAAALRHTDGSYTILDVAIPRESDSAEPTTFLYRSRLFMDNVPNDGLVILNFLNYSGGFYHNEVSVKDLMVSHYTGTLKAMVPLGDRTILKILTPKNPNDHSQGTREVRQMIYKHIDKVDWYVQAGDKVHKFGVLGMPYVTYTSALPVTREPEAEDRNMYAKFSALTGIKPQTQTILEQYRMMTPSEFHTVPVYEGRSRIETFRELRKELGNYFGKTRKEIQELKDAGIEEFMRSEVLKDG